MGYYNFVDDTGFTECYLPRLAVHISAEECQPDVTLGIEGSEYRVLTVALMLGDKCMYNRLPQIATADLL